ncbi:MAG TPA: DNA helicase RecQ [Planctomycetota bacterium]|nr:DNA helicase RecQ [Planctomycetota bacterium]
MSMSPAEALLEAPSAAVPAALSEAIRRVWGYTSLRPLQAEAMNAALAGRDTLVVLATGAGKSLCYQAPALIRPGLTVVVSPLISLMKDQADGLVGNGVSAAMLTSAQDGGERRLVREKLALKSLRILFVAPERLLLDGFFEELCAAGLSSLVIDEAHCISHWGHDFRPEYRQIGALRRLHPELPVQAYTATATPAVREDIALQLSLRDPLRLVGSFDRPNLTYRFQPRGETLSQVLAVVRRHPEQAGIVYCLRRKDVDELARDLAAAGVRALPYHAGLTPEVRKHHQEQFLQERIDVIVATVAFGMGIDRSDVRYVVHASLPKGIEQYSQESGRAGRDGLAAECVLLYSAADYHGWKGLMEKSAEDASAAGNGDGGAELEASLARLAKMLVFANGAVCRHKFLDEHFGGVWKPKTEGCGACDVCLGELQPIEDAKIVAQKVLSCVVRCDQRYGAGQIADVLRGANTERVRRAQHDKLSTFGLMRDHDAREIRHWIDQLVALEHLRVTNGQYPTLFLSRSGVEVMRGERVVTLFALPKLSKSSKARTSAAAAAGLSLDPGTAEARLFEVLRALRRKLAQEKGVPPYLIFNDRTLAELAARRPKSPEEFRQVKGVGDRKAQELGEIFLAEIAGNEAG